MKYFKDIYNNKLRNLNNVIRYSGSFCIKPETDGYHVIDMMSICMKIREILKDELGVILDKKDLIYRCYCHDLDEIITGDISRVVKYYNSSIRNAISEVTDEVMTTVVDGEIMNDICTSKSFDSFEGMVVAIADTIQASLKIYEEVKLGNFHFHSILRGHIDFLDNLSNKVRSSELFNTPKGEDIINVLSEIINHFKLTVKKEIDKIED